MLTTTILGEAIGVQHGGIQDRTSSNTVQGITHGLIIGKFKRGRTDQPMRINKDTIKARLGYEPNNPFYQAVQDCVDKFPSVWVLRVGDSNSVVVPPTVQISCEGAWGNATVIAYYESSDPQNLINAADSAFSYVVDGVEIELLPSSIERRVEVFYKEDNLALTSRVEITFINISALSQSIRLQLIKKANAILFYDSPNFNDRNPTLMRDDFGNFAVCLARSEV